MDILQQRGIRQRGTKWENKWALPQPGQFAAGLVYQESGPYHIWAGGVSQYITSIGLFQQIKGCELAAGYRHLQTLSGGDFVLNADNTIVYPRDTREISDALEAGVSSTTRGRIRYGFHSRTVFDGNNTDRKFWVGASIDIPFGGKRTE